MINDYSFHNLFNMNTNVNYTPFCNLINNEILTEEQLSDLKFQNSPLLIDLHTINIWINSYADRPDAIKCIKDNIFNGYSEVIHNLRRITIEDILKDYPNLMSCILDDQYSNYFRTVFANIYDNKYLYAILERGFTSKEHLFIAMKQLGDNICEMNKNGKFLDLMMG